MQGALLVAGRDLSGATRARRWRVVSWDGAALVAGLRVRDVASNAHAIEPKLLGTMVQGIAQLSGADPKTTMALTMAFSMAAAITVGIATAVVSGNAAKLVNTLTDQTMKMVNTVVQGVGAAISGATQIGQGAANIAKGVYAEQGEKALAGKKELEAFLAKINQNMEDQREELRKLIQQLEEGVQSVSQMISASADSMSQITSNLGKRAAV